MDDADVQKCLALLTFLPMDEVRRLGALEGSKINDAKKVLAFEVTKLIHGEEEALKAQAAAEALFGGGQSGPGRWQATHLRMSFPEILRLRQQLLSNVLLSYAPDLLLVDHMPHGAMGELLPALEALEKAGIQTQAVLGLRDILDSPEVTINRWQVEGAFEALERYYSRILVFGMQDVFDVAKKYQFPEEDARKVFYCGYVTNLDNERNTHRIRARYLSNQDPDTRLIVVMAGGGADAYPIMSTLIEALPQVLKEQPCVLVVITGPFMPAELIADLERRSAELPIHMLESIDDTLSHISAADLVIAMAGYNTSVEILRVKTPAILIPAPARVRSSARVPVCFLRNTGLT